MWSTGEGNGKPLQYSCLENPINCMKTQKDRTLKDELPRSVGAQYATGDQWRNNSTKNEEKEPKQKQHPVVDMTGDGSKVWCCKKQYFKGTLNVRSRNQGKLKEVKQEMARVSQSVQLLSSVQLFETTWIGVYQGSLSITNFCSLPILMSIESAMLSNYLIFSQSLLHLISVLPSIMVFSNKSVLCIRWPKYWSFSFNISPSKENSGLKSFRVDWLDLLAVQGALINLQHHSSKALILWCTAFFIIQLSHPNMPTGKKKT